MSRSPLRSVKASRSLFSKNEQAQYALLVFDSFEKRVETSRESFHESMREAIAVEWKKEGGRDVEDEGREKGERREREGRVRKCN